MPQDSVDLSAIFSSVTRSLAENQQSLNQADQYNQDHGNNMVQTFQTITNALQQKKGSSTSTALSYAANQLSQTANSSSSKLYAENLAQAAGQFKGKNIDLQGALQLLQMLIGGGKSNSGNILGSLLGGGQQTQSAGTGGGDLLGSLLGGLVGGGQQSPGASADSGQQAQNTGSGGGDLLGSLLGGLGGGQQSQGAGSGGGLLGSLLGGLGGGQQGSGGGIQGLIQAFTGSSRMGDASHRTQSTEIVVNSFLKALGGSGQ